MLLNLLGATDGVFGCFRGHFEEIVGRFKGGVYQCDFVLAYVRFDVVLEEFCGEFRRVLERFT